MSHSPWGQRTVSHSPWSRCRFHLAATRGNVDCLEAMLAHGVDAMTKDSSGEGMATTCPCLVPHRATGCPQVLRLRGQRCWPHLGGGNLSQFPKGAQAAPDELLGSCPSRPAPFQQILLCARPSVCPQAVPSGTAVL